MTNTRTLLATLAFGALALPALAPSALAESPQAKAAKADIQATTGAVPTFVGAVADSALASLWQETKSLELSDKTALPPKTKALISLAVAAQIPCTYCVWAETADARRFGATDQEIAEAVAMAGLTRNWSTIFNGMQVDLATFKKDLASQ